MSGKNSKRKRQKKKPKKKKFVTRKKGEPCSLSFEKKIDLKHSFKISHDFLL